MGSANLLARYPQNTVWYIEGYKNGEPASSGSAVAVWLKKKDDSRPGRIYLLTCAHVVRGTAAKSMGVGLGPVLDKIKVWQPGTSYAAYGLNASIAQEITPLANNTLSTENLTPANDWVLLEVENQALAKGVDHVYRWDDPGDGEFTIFGYPGGDKSFSGGVVMPVEVKDFRFVARHDEVLILRGSESRPGMSGAPLFNQTGGLIGIHRSKTDATLLFHSISAVYIRRQLEERGYITRTPGQESVSNLREQFADVAKGIPWPGKVRQLNQIRLEVLQVLDRDPNHSEAKYLLDDTDRAIRYYRWLPWLAVLLMALLIAAVAGSQTIPPAIWPTPRKVPVREFVGEWNNRTAEGMRQEYLTKRTWLGSTIPTLLTGKCEIDIDRTKSAYYELLPDAPDTGTKRIRVIRKAHSEEPRIKSSLQFEGFITEIQGDIVVVKDENYRVLAPQPPKPIEVERFYAELNNIKDMSMGIDELKRLYEGKRRLTGKLPLKRAAKDLYVFDPPSGVNPAAAKEIYVMPRGTMPDPLPRAGQLFEFEGLIDKLDITNVFLRDATVHKLSN